MDLEAQILKLQSLFPLTGFKLEHDNVSCMKTRTFLQENPTETIQGFVSEYFIDCLLVPVLINYIGTWCANAKPY